MLPGTTAGPHEADDHPAPRGADPILADCYPGVAVIPVLLLLILLWIDGALGAGADPRGAWYVRPRALRLALPPQLPPAQRRALLQVFRI